MPGVACLCRISLLAGPERKGTLALPACRLWRLQRVGLSLSTPCGLGHDWLLVCGAAVYSRSFTIPHVPSGCWHIIASIIQHCCGTRGSVRPADCTGVSSSALRSSEAGYENHNTCTVRNCPRFRYNSTLIVRPPRSRPLLLFDSADLIRGTAASQGSRGGVGWCWLSPT